MLILGQRESIQLILEGKSALLLLPTGGGKSLCYQLPAFILRNNQNTQHTLTLVVSPMISLMNDQMRCLPSFLKGGCLNSESVNSYFIKASASKSVLSQLVKNQIDVLFVSPEKLRTDSFMELVLNKKISAFNFVCIDEVHCMSEWSHNFRTSYLHLPSTLFEDLNVECVLSMTGTATETSKGSICEMLKIEPENIISHGLIRENLITSVWKIEKIEER